MSYPFDNENEWLSGPEFSQAERTNLREFVDALPLPPPAEIFTQLEALGYKGQEEPRRALSLMAYRHIRRLKRLHVDGELRLSLPPKQNTLLVGPTGQREDLPGRILVSTAL
jgi:ATP-dependent Clp protease ATP-binding subunit ClpX